MEPNSKCHPIGSCTSPIPMLSVTMSSPPRFPSASPCSFAFLSIILHILGKHILLSHSSFSSTPANSNLSRNHIFLDFKFPIDFLRESQPAKSRNPQVPEGWPKKGCGLCHFSMWGSPGFLSTMPGDVTMPSCKSSCLLLKWYHL